MLKKLLATAAIAAIALLAIPSAAQAAGYVAADLISVSGDQQAGGNVRVTFKDGAFANGEKVSVAVTGRGAVTLGFVQAVTIDAMRSATRRGALDLTVALPTNATGSYSLTATGMNSQSVGAATITVVAADGTSSLPSAGFGVPAWLLYSVAVVLVLGLALVLIRRGWSRRQRLN